MRSISRATTLADRLAAVLGARGLVDERPRGGDVARHLGEHELQALQLRQRRPERLALLEVRRRLLERGSGDPDARRADRDPALGQARERDSVSPALVAEAVRGRERRRRRRSARRRGRPGCPSSSRGRRTGSRASPFSTRNAVMPFEPFDGSTSRRRGTDPPRARSRSRSSCRRGDSAVVDLARRPGFEAPPRRCRRDGFGQAERPERLAGEHRRRASAPICSSVP